MRKIYSILLFFSLLAGMFLSCSDDDKYIPVPPTVAIESLSGEFALPQDDSVVLAAKVESALATTLSWSVNGKEVSILPQYTFTGKETGSYEVKLTATNADGAQVATVNIEVYGKYKYGTFILNEGYSAASTSTLIFISLKGIITDSVYYKANGTMLEYISQDLFIANNKLYIISQKNEDADQLVVANAETLKKEAGYKTELQGLSNPTHIAVLGDDDIYLRDNDGVQLFHPSTGTVSLIEGTEKARKNTMAVVDGKVFATLDKTVVVIEKGKDTISESIEFDTSVRGVVKSSDGNLWVSTSSGKIYKVNAKDYSIIKTNDLPSEAITTQSASFASTPCITAKGDTLYMSGSTKIYRHIFSKNQTDLMVDFTSIVQNPKNVYNTIAVNPATGEVYLNTFKGWGDDRLINDINVFDFSGTEPKLSADYKNYTNYPAGTFFTYNFQ